MSIFVRVLLGVLGSYGFTTGIVALATMLLMAAMPRAEAFTLAGMLALPLYLGAALWCFAEPRLTRIGAVLLGGGSCCFALAGLLARLAA